MTYYNSFAMRESERRHLQPGESEEQVVSECAHCENLLMQGESALQVEDHYYCDEDCFNEWAYEMFQPKEIILRKDDY